MSPLLPPLLPPLQYQSVQNGMSHSLLLRPEWRTLGLVAEQQAPVRKS